jgi:pilus assembly protein Flp/PilA
MDKVLGRISAYASSQITRFRREDEGATAVEYGLIIGLISVAVIAGAIVIGGWVGGAFTAVGTKLGGVPTP